MNKFVKLVEGMLEFAPVNKNNILNYNTNEELMRADGYKEFIEIERPVTNRRYHVEYTETKEKIKEKIVYDETQEEADKREAQEERQRLDHLSLTKREVFLAIYRDKQITPEQIREMITDPEGLIEFDFASSYFRGNPLIGMLGEALGYTPYQLDVLFETGIIPQDENK